MAVVLKRIFKALNEHVLCFQIGLPIFNENFAICNEFFKVKSSWKAPQTSNWCHRNVCGKWIFFRKATWNSAKNDEKVLFFCHVQKWSFSSVGNHNDLTPCWGLKSSLIQLHEDIFIFEKKCEFNCIWAWWSHGVDCWNWQKFL